MALSIGFRVSVSLHPAIQVTGRLALAPAGLTPARRTCLLWTRNDLIRPPQHRRRDRQAERLRGLDVDDQLEPGGPLDGEVARLGTLENPVHVGRKLTEDRPLVRPVTHQTTRFHVAPIREGRWQAVPGCQLHDSDSMRPEHVTRYGGERLWAFTGHGC